MLWWVLSHFERKFTNVQQLQPHCQTFKDDTYPNKLVGLANVIYNFADEAGGESDSSYYATIISMAKQLATLRAADPSTLTPDRPKGAFSVIAQRH